LEQRIDGQSSNPLVLIGILAAAALGVGLAAIFWLPSVQSILNSPRGSGLIPNFAFGVAPAKIFNSIRHSIKWAKAQALIHVMTVDDKKGVPSIPKMTIDELKERLRKTPVKDALTDKKASAFKLTRFRDTLIEGRVKLTQPGVLVFQMPFDNGWQAVVDHQSARPIKADIGLIAVDLSAGEHLVELHYVPPFLYMGGGVTLMSISVLLARAWKRPRLTNPLQLKL
jgi:Predicted membrane protein